MAPSLAYVSVQRPQNRAGHLSRHPARQSPHVSFLGHHLFHPPGLLGQAGQHPVIDMPSRLAVDARRPSARVLAHAFPGVLQQLPMADQTIQLAEPLTRIGCGEVAQMFKFAQWVAPEV